MVLHSSVALLCAIEASLFSNLEIGALALWLEIGRKQPCFNAQALGQTWADARML